MSLLAPLYLAGALAIGLPILFHMIRRRPRGEVKFSSLMFLRPTPPTLTRRSRLDNWLLLLIRALALLLLAAAFTRPYLRSSAKSDVELPTRRIVIAVDTSASMRRAGLWNQAKSKVDEVLADLRPGDEIAVVAFDSAPTTLLRFDQTNRLEPAQIRSSVNSVLAETSPSWAATDLGQAISYAADLAVTYEPDDGERVDSEPAGELAVEVAAADSRRDSGPAKMILVTDMQAGSKLESLQVYTWPKQLSLDIRQVSSDRKTNATAQLLQVPNNAPEEAAGVRVRVSNSADADQSTFQVSWTEANGKPIEATEMPVQVPPGESRVVRMPAATPGVTSMSLQGDDHDFDNTFHIVSPQPKSLTLLHLGASDSISRLGANPGSETVADTTGANPQTADQARSSLFFYLQRVPLSTSIRTVTTESMPPEKLTEVPDSKHVPLVVVTEPFSSETAELLSEYINGGGQLLYVLADARNIDGSTAALRSLTKVDGLTISEASVNDYAMLSRIDFRHPLFASMADPQFNDFTKIRFWSHRTLAEFPETWNVLARFDDGDPALVEQTMGAGKLWVLAAGWQPEASQLALSTKFIPLIFSLFDPNTSSLDASNQHSVGDHIAFEPSPTAQITLPGGQKIRFQNVSDFQTFELPGIYQFTDGDTSSSIAVNLESAESRTDAIGSDALERFGISLSPTLSTAQELTNQRQLRDHELESQQRLWQWLLVAALALLGLETFLGGWLSKPRPATTELATS